MASKALFKDQSEMIFFVRIGKVFTHSIRKYATTRARHSDFIWSETTIRRRLREGQKGYWLIPIYTFT